MNDIVEDTKKFTLDFSDVYLKNCETPDKYWSQKDLTEVKRLQEECNEEIKKWRLENDHKYQSNDASQRQRLILLNELKETYDRQIVDIKNKLNGYEKDQVDMMVEMFSQQYDMKDIRVYLIVKEFLRNYIINNRIQKEMLATSMIREEYFNDESRLLPNVLLKAKHDYSKLYLETIKVLDSMTKGDKLIENQLTTTKTFYDVFLSKIPEVPVKVVDVFSR